MPLCNTFDTAANHAPPPSVSWCNSNMVFEQMLTILLGTGVGVAAVLYTVKPRQVGASQSFGSGVSSIETISLPSESTFSQNEAAPTPEVSATQSPAVEAPVEEFHAIPSGSVSTMTADVAVAGASDAAIALIDASAVSSPASRPFTVESHTAPAAGAHRAPRKGTASSRTHAKPRASGPASGRITRKR
jgi:hypothetical protein